MLLARINAETVAIDLAMLFMEDDVLANAIIARHNAGVRVRALVEPRRNTTTPKNDEILARLAAAGIPMRSKNGGGMLHWKFMIFDAQNQVQFSAANYSDFYFRPTVPYSNYTDEGIFFTDDLGLVNSFRRKFDDAWIDPSAFLNYANITSLTRRYAVHPVDPSLSFVPFEDFATRSVPLYDAEQQRIDIVMYKITEPRHADAIIRARQRGIPVRLITEGERYRNAGNLWQAYHIDRLHMAGVQIRDRAHEGFLHQKNTLLYGQGLTVFGSSNWTIESNERQYEHNYFTDKPWFFEWFRQNFERKWANATGAVETAPFVPKPPDPPVYVSPANGATGVPTTGATLRFNPGTWGHRADIYVGTTLDPPLVAANVVVSPTDNHTYTLPALSAGTTYYWRVVNKTIAMRGAPGAVRSFTTAGGSTPPPPPPNAPPSVTISSPANNSTFTAPGNISIAATATDSDGSVTRVDFFAGSSAIGADTTAPFQFSWTNVPAGTYTLTARATDSAGASATSSPVTVTVASAPPPPPPPPPSLPSPWQAQDVGSVGMAGSASASGGTFTVRGAGADIWGTADAFQFVWQRLSGDSDVIARVASIENVHAWVKAGVMIRETLTAGSPHALMLVSPGKGLAFQRRVAAGGLSTHTSGGAGTAPAWVKLERRGATISAFVSSNGTTWTPVGSDSFTMGASVYVGLAVSSHDAARAATATFDQVTARTATVGTPPPPPPPPSSAEIVLRASDAARLVGSWAMRSDSTAAGGQATWLPDAGRAKVITAVAAPADYVEFTFNAEAGRAYRLWIRGRALNDDWASDSVHVQFSGSVNAEGTAVYRIGTTSSAEYNLESCKGCGLAGWGWEDNGWGVNVLGPVIYFATTGPQTIRIQNREDGLSIDQIVLSSSRYLTASPGATKNDTTIVPR